MVKTPWCIPALVAILILGTFAGSARLQPMQKGDKEQPPGKSKPINDELFDLLKTHLRTNDRYARAIVESELPTVLAKPMKHAQADDELRKLRKTRYNAILAMTALWYHMNIGGGESHIDEYILNWSRRLEGAGLEVYEHPKERVAFLKQMIELCDKMAMDISRRRDDLDKTYSRLSWRIFALDVQIELLKAEKAAKAEK